MSSIKKRNKITVQSFIKMKAAGKKIVMLTAYDWFTARLLDQANIDSLLVGDSAANVIHGHESTLPIDLETPRHRRHPGECPPANHGKGLTAVKPSAPPHPTV